MLTIWTGQPAPTPGYYRDDHGHRILLRPGEPAPICPVSGATVIRWRLVRPVPMPLPRP